ncbi:MAG: hypothetical protein FJX74_07150 [Armatimonadetes bacterium]|nr:hypothetical protein [Armatimonadota bacterium]
MLTPRRLVTGSLVAVALVAATFALRPVLRAQGIEDEELSAETLRRDIRFLQMLARLGMTAEQRGQAATAIEAARQKREAARQLAEPPELLTALATVQQALLRGEEPTDAMREAVEAAQPPDDGVLDRAYEEARTEAVGALRGLLTGEQREQLAILPLIGLAEEIIGMCMASRQAPAEEGQEMRLHAFGEVRDQLAFTAGPDADRALSDFQGLINRIAALAPEQAEEQREQLVAQLVTLMKTTFERNPGFVEERLGDQLWGWVTEPRVGELFRRSGEAMGAQ